MAVIRVDTNGLVTIRQLVSNIETQISNANIQFTYAKNDVDFKTAASADISNRLRSLQRRMKVQETKLSQYSATLYNVTNQFSDTDKSVAQNAKDIEYLLLRMIIGDFASSTKENLSIFERKNTLKYLLSQFGVTAFDRYGLIYPLPIFRFNDWAKVVAKHASKPWFVKFLKDDWELEGALLAGTAVATGTILGFNSSLTMEGELVGGSLKTKSHAKWKPEKGEVNIGKSVEAEGYLAKGSLDGNIGYLGGTISGTVGSAATKGTLGVSLYKNGKLSPAIEAKIKAEAAVAKGEAEVNFGTDETDIHVKGSGTLLGAEAEAGASAGKITYQDESGATKTEYGVSAKAGAEAYLAQGKVSGGLTLFGIDFDVGVSGKAGGAGASASARATTGGASGSIGAGLGLGVGLEISVDWSEFSLW